MNEPLDVASGELDSLQRREYAASDVR